MEVYYTTAEHDNDKYYRSSHSRPIRRRIGVKPRLTSLLVSLVLYCSSQRRFSVLLFSRSGRGIYFRNIAGYSCLYGLWVPKVQSQKGTGACVV